MNRDRKFQGDVVMKVSFYRLHLLFVFIGLFISGCGSWQPYNKDNPNEYQQYWQDEQNRKNSYLYQYTNEYQEERKNRK